MIKKGLLLLSCVALIQGVALAAPSPEETADESEVEYTASVPVLQGETDSEDAEIGGESDDVTLSYRESLLHRLREERELGYYMDFPESLAVTMSTEELEAIFGEDDDYDDDEVLEEYDDELDEKFGGFEESSDTDEYTDYSSEDEEEDEEDVWDVLYDHREEAAVMFLGGGAAAGIFMTRREDEYEYDEEDDEDDSSDGDDDDYDGEDEAYNEDEVTMEDSSRSTSPFEPSGSPAELAKDAVAEESEKSKTDGSSAKSEPEKVEKTEQKTDGAKTDATTLAKADSPKSNNKSSSNIKEIGSGHVEPAAVYHTLRDLGFNKVAACGIMGNIMMESSFNTCADNEGDYFGLCQWDTDGRWPALVQYAESNGMNPYDASAQLCFMCYEAENSWRSEWCAVKEVNQCESPEEAASYWQRYYEGAAGQADYARASYARDYYETFA